MRHYWQLVATVAALVLAHVLPAGAQPAAGSDTPTPAGVRPTSAKVAAVLTATLERSPTLRQIVRDIETNGGLVYVQDDSSAALRQRGLAGATSLKIVCVRDRRLIHVALVTGRGDATIESLGHELQHARELLESNVTDAAGAAASIGGSGCRRGQVCTKR